jgi:hypothetical protein
MHLGLNPRNCSSAPPANNDALRTHRLISAFYVVVKSGPVEARWISLRQSLRQISGKRFDAERVRAEAEPAALIR